MPAHFFLTAKFRGGGGGQAREGEEVVLNVDCANIADFDPVLYGHLVAYPTEVIPLMDEVAQEVALEADGPQDAAFELQACQPPRPAPAGAGCAASCSWECRGCYLRNAQKGWLSSAGMLSEG